MWTTEYFIWLGVLACVAFVQNMAFTWTSRSRNSGDPNYHRFAALCSNGVWFVCHLLVWKSVWKALESSDPLPLIPVGIVYTLATTEGSVLCMKILLKREEGKRQVGAR